MSKLRLDALLVERGLISTRERAKAAVMSGAVCVNGNRAVKPGLQVDDGAVIDVRAADEYVSRGGQKLEKAIESFGVSPEGKVCIDCGASTGGFTDCLLRHGAKLVYAVDVGYGQLAWSIRTDSRVITMERTNIRYVTPEMLDTVPELAVADLSFISLKLVLPVLSGLIAEKGEALCLIKPQFEAGRERVGSKGVVRDRETHRDVLNEFSQNAEKSGFSLKGLTFSPVKGPKGNIEFLGWLCRSGESEVIDFEAVVSEAHSGLQA